MSFVPTPEQVAAVGPMIATWTAKSGAMSPEFQAKQGAAMMDPEQKAAGDKHWKESVWPNCNTDGSMDLAGYRSMMTLMATREDEVCGDHV